ncbi:sucrase ferredoxin [Rhodococcus daqingensis]|uniref:Sucrase ferredoxin n=1 Tax=Rhodococcus daqingensis TaxID=2479363 RepID=A0ABW2RSZ7_9NOCA
MIENPQASRRSDACTRRSSAAGEPMVARAGHTRLWVLIEHPGPWPKSAPAGVLPQGLLDRIDELGDPARLVLIRRPRRREVTEPRWILAWSDGVNQWMREGVVDSYDDLAALPFEASAAGLEPAAGTARSAPLFVVCTHGKKDACCAELGRPIVTALSAVDGADVWECTHIGGDRFAANMIALPAGVYFSRLGAESARAAARDHLAGRMSLAQLRGRAALPQPAQVAEHVIRETTGIVALDALESYRVTTATDNTAVVDLRIAARDFRVVVRSGPPEEPFRHGCIPDTAATWNRWIVDRFDERVVE